MKYKYVGPDRGSCFAYGYDFSKGAVECKGEHALSKLAANPEFEAVKSNSKTKKEPVKDGLDKLSEDELKVKYEEVMGKKPHVKATVKSMTKAIRKKLK